MGKDEFVTFLLISFDVNCLLQLFDVVVVVGVVINKGLKRSNRLTIFRKQKAIYDFNTNIIKIYKLIINLFNRIDFFSYIIYWFSKVVAVAFLFS